MAARARPFLRSRWSLLLAPVSVLYGAAASRRRTRLTRSRVRLPVPVISVGNITCGGTGKTPVVEMVVRDLIAHGVQPAILSRGYRAARDGLNDEARLLALNLPGVPHFLGADRVAWGKKAIEVGAEALVLDDGFQHARLARDLDLVLIDALDPFGGGRVLPAGLLREPLDALRSADLFLITRGSLVSPSLLGVLHCVLRERFPGIPRVEMEMVPRGWDPLGGGASLEPEALGGKRAAAFAGIGNPEAFRRQLQTLGVEVAAWLPFPDHHHPGRRDLEEIRRRAAAAGAQAVVTTQKDAVKISGDPSGDGPSWWALRIGCRPAAGALDLRRSLDRLLEPKAAGARA